MKDLGIKRFLQVGAAGSLLLGVQGCGTSPSSVTKDFCEAQKKCDSDFFDANWESVSDCVSDNEDYADESYDQYVEEYGKDCAKASLDYQGCLINEYKSSCEYDDAYAGCESEYDKVIEKCDFDLGDFDLEYYDY